VVGLLVQERQTSQDSSGPIRGFKETRLDSEPPSPLLFSEPYLPGFVMERSISPPMPLLLPQVSLGGGVGGLSDHRGDPLAGVGGLNDHRGDPMAGIQLEDCDLSDRSETGDSGKENEEVLVWRGSRSSLTSRDSRGSRPRSGHLSDVTGVHTQLHTLPLSSQQMPLSSQQMHLSSQQMPLTSNSSGSKVDRVTRSAMGKAPLSLQACERLQNEFNIAENPHLLGHHSTQSPPTPHKIIRVKEGSGICNPLQKLKQISLTPKKNVANKSSQKTVRTKSVSSSFPSDVAASSPSSKAGKLAAAAQGSHKVTEYFPIRRSERKPKAELLKEQMEGIEVRLLSTDDSQLDIEIREIENKGRGIVTKRDFDKGEFVVEYSGDLIDIGTAKELENKYSMDTSKGCYMYYFKHKGKQYCIDATGESGRYGRLLNHSRVSPNCITKVVMLGDIPRLILVARQDLAEGTELVYDYGDRSKESLVAHPWLAL